MVDEIDSLVSTKGWESYIAYGRGKGEVNSRLIKIGNKWNIIKHILLTRFFDRHGLGSKKATYKLVERIKEIKPAIIHLHNIHGYYLNISVLFRYLENSNIPVIWTLHDCWSFTGHCAHFDHIGCMKWKVHCDNCPQKAAYPRSWFRDRSYKNFTLKKKIYSNGNQITVVAVSEWIRNIAKSSILSGFKIRMIHNWTDTDVFKSDDNKEMIRSKYGIKDQFLLLGVASKWCERKGFDDYLELSRLLPDGYLILLVGLSRKQLAKLSGSIIGTPRTDNVSELSALYSAADVVLNLSPEESFGLTTVEGLACGTPGIVYNCTASPELISQETGFVVEKGDLRGVIAAAQLIKAKGKEYYKERCVDRAKSCFNKIDQISKYLNLYESVLDRVNR